MKVALVIPTRGLLFARTIVSTILRHSGTVFIVEGLPIPQAHNECIKRALATDCTHIWFVEEDMEVPEGGYEAMCKLAEQGKRYVAIDYPVTNTINAVVYDRDTPWFTGFGCTMFDRTLFEKEFQYPGVTDEYDVMILHEDPLKIDIIKRPPTTNPAHNVYGKYDVYFGAQCKQKGIDITVVPDMMCKHLRVESTARNGHNDNVFRIYEL